MTDRDYRLLTMDQAATALEVRRQQLLDLIETGGIRAVKIGARWRIPASAIGEVQAERELAAQAPPEPPEEQFTPGRHRIPLRVRFLVLKRCGFACSYCGRRPPEVQLQVDHIVPVVDGGLNTPSNLTAACWECNIGKFTERVDFEAPQ